MTSQDIVGVLKNVPEKRLRLIELAQEVIGPDGKLDTEKAMYLSQEVTSAIQEAEAYSQATRRIAWALKRLIR